MDTVDRIFDLSDRKYAEQRDLAKAIGVTPSIVSQWRNRITKSYERRLPQIAAALDTTVEYLLTGEEKKPGPEQGAELIPGWSDLSTENKIRTQEYIALLLASQRKD